MKLFDVSLIATYVWLFRIFWNTALFRIFWNTFFLINISLKDATSFHCTDFVFKVFWKSFDLKIGPHLPHLAPFTHSWIYSKPLQNKIIKTSDATTPAKAPRHRIKKKTYFSQKLMKIYPANAQIVKFIIQTEGYVCILIHKIKTSGFVSLNIHFKSTLLNNSKTSSGNNFT